MADVFDDESEGEPTISMKDYLEAVEEEELVSDFLENSDKNFNFKLIQFFSALCIISLRLMLNRYFNSVKQSQ